MNQDLTPRSVLMVGSEAGNRLTSSRFEAQASAGEEKGPNMAGFYNRKENRHIGLIFDVIDSALAYQGLPTASAFDAISHSKGSGGISYMTGHSLGSIDVNNLAGWGFVRSADVQALPFGNFANPRVSVELLRNDPISLFWFGFLTNPWASDGGSPGVIAHGRCNFSTGPYGGGC